MLVLSYAKTQLQDVVGQDLPTTVELIDEVMDDSDSVRRMPAVLVDLLKRCGEDIGKIISESPTGARAITHRSFQGRPNSIARATNIVLHARTADWSFTVLHLDLLARKKERDSIIGLVAKPGSPLQYLSAPDDWITDASIELVAANCPQLRFNLRNAHITDDSIRLIAQLSASTAAECV